MSDIQTVGQRTLSQKARSNARFLRDNFDDLHGPEADTVASKLEECADHIEKLQNQLAERDAALARCVEALETLLAVVPTSTQATAKVLAAARNLVSVWDAYNAADFDDTSKPVPSIPDAAMGLREAIREEKEGK